MPHKNERALTHLRRLGGDDTTARRAFAPTAALDEEVDLDALDLKKLKTLTRVVEHPDGRRKSSTRTADERDDLRAVLVALTVAQKNGMALKMPSKAELSRLSSEALQAIVQLALPKAPMPGAFTFETQSGAKKILEALHELTTELTKWLKLAKDGHTVLGHPVVQNIFQADITRLELKRASLKNVQILIAEIQQAGGIFSPLDDNCRLTTAMTGGTLQAVALWNIGQSDNSPHQNYLKIDNVVAHPSSQLHLLPDTVQWKGAGIGILNQIEANAASGSDCTVSYLQAGTQDLLPFYVQRGYSVVQEMDRPNRRRRGSLSSHLDGEETTRARNVPRTAETASKVINLTMAKAL